MDSTTIASKDDDESDYDELSKCLKGLLIWIKLILSRCHADKEDENLVKPEFEGLWNAEFKNYDAEDLYNKKLKFPSCFKSKMEQVSSLFWVFFKKNKLKLKWFLKGYLFANFG